MPTTLRRFLIAVQFLTRLPVPRNLATTEEELGAAAAFFPLVGVLVGGGAALTFVGLQFVLPHSACVWVALGAAVLLTNAFHEDGLADAFDGFGGGWSRERVLEIMRDSRLGTYGTLALIFLMLGKFNFLGALPADRVWRWLIVAHTAARWTVLPLCAWLPYARAEGQGKLVARRIGPAELVVGTIVLLATLALLPWRAGLAVLLLTGLTPLLCGLYFRARLQGLTGDCLGAANQLTELALYLCALLLWRLQGL
jgi:adenosylcobinamide-GDP ribazoletransferase